MGLSYVALILLSVLALTTAWRRETGNSVDIDDVGGEDASRSNEEDEITDLPGLEGIQINFQHYSGYLQASPTRFLHYWFVTSQGRPETDPLVFWFNGGPGCSSLEGLLNEMGPYVMNDDGKTLRQNPYAWNKFASVVYIEAPAGVGYSYASDGNTTTDDDITAQQNYQAVKQFFTKFPNFRNHSTFITGESYGGVYVPTLTSQIVDGQGEFPINLKGMAIGNGYVDAKLNIDTSVRYAYGHGLIDEKVWNSLELECCRGCIDGCDLTQLGGHCGTMVNDVFEYIWHGGLNPYDLYRDCDPSPTRANKRKMKALRRGLMPSFVLGRRLPGNSTLEKSGRHSHTRHHRNWHMSVGGPSVPCMNDTAVTNYMNSDAVKRALHISEHSPQWEICSEDISMNYGKIYTDMAPFIKKILKAHVRVLLYYGDTDMACNFMMGQQFSARLGLKRALNKQPWKFNRQVAGFKTLYGSSLTFLTIRGAGHMAPQWRAPQMDYVMQQFLINHPI